MALSWASVRALATDYDGTLAHEGQVAEATTNALGGFKASGRRLVLVTGRELAALRAVFPYLGLFDACVCENGATLYRPDREIETPLAPGPTPELLAALAEARVEPLVRGRVILATEVENEPRLLEALDRFGAGWRTIRNKNSVMALPAGIDKGSGLAVALAGMDLDAASVVGVGDAENDEPLLAACGIGAAVANALPGLKAIADVVTRGPEGEGVVELVELILAAPCAPAASEGPAAA